MMPAIDGRGPVLHVSVREARLTLDRIFLAAGVPDGMVPSVRDHALASAALHLGGWPMVRDRHAAIGAGDASQVRLAIDDGRPCIDAADTHAWLAGPAILDLCVDAAQRSGRATFHVRNVADPGELAVLVPLCHRHGARVAIRPGDRSAHAATATKGQGRIDTPTLVLDITMTEPPRTRSEWDPVLDRALHEGLEVDTALWWELHHLSNRALSPDTVESRRHAGPVIVTADGQVIGRPVDDDTDFSLLKQAPRSGAADGIHAKERQQ